MQFACVSRVCVPHIITRWNALLITGGAVHTWCELHFPTTGWVWGCRAACKCWRRVRAREPDQIKCFRYEQVQTAGCVESVLRQLLLARMQIDVGVRRTRARAKIYILLWETECRPPPMFCSHGSLEWKWGWTHLDDWYHTQQSSWIWGVKFFGGFWKMRFFLKILINFFYVILLRVNENNLLLHWGFTTKIKVAEQTNQFSKKVTFDSETTFWFMFCSLKASATSVYSVSDDQAKVTAAHAGEPKNPNKRRTLDIYSAKLDGKWHDCRDFGSDCGRDQGSSVIAD